jgi:hypothetical protein
VAKSAVLLEALASLVDAVYNDGLDNVSPAIVDTVAPEATCVDPIVGVKYPGTSGKSRLAICITPFISV